MAGPAAANGCSFAGRCPLVRDECRSLRPPLLPVAPDRASACLRWNEVAAFEADAGERNDAARRRLRRLQARFETGESEAR